MQILPTMGAASDLQLLGVLDVVGGPRRLAGGQRHQSPVSLSHRTAREPGQVAPELVGAVVAAEPALHDEREAGRR